MRTPMTLILLTQDRLRHWHSVGIITSRIATIGDRADGPANVIQLVIIITKQTGIQGFLIEPALPTIATGDPPAGSYRVKQTALIALLNAKLVSRKFNPT